MTDADLGHFIAESDIAYLILDHDGNIIESSRSAQEILSSISPDQTAGGKNIKEYVHQWLTAEEQERIVKNIKSEKKSFTAEINIPGLPGRPIWFQFQITRTDRGYFFCLIENISKQKILEQDLRFAKEDMERTSNSKSRFLANVTHEIRTPIQTIIGMMELIEDTDLDQEQTEYIRQARFSADVLLSLVNDFLDLSKIESGKYTIETIAFDLIKQVEQTVDLISMEAHRRGLEVITDIHPLVSRYVRGDPKRLQQVILNLVKNAVKFTQDGYVLVSVYPDTKTAMTCFDVIDTGIGVSEEVKQHLFSHFYQGDSSITRKFGGTGLGLSISKNLVQLMNGEIGVKNNFNESGSIFWFRLPLPAASPEESGQAGSCMRTPDIPADMRFLVVDDMEIALRSLAHKLKAFGCVNVVLSPSGADALKKMKEAAKKGKPFDIVFIDMIMPEIDGWRLAAEINTDRTINNAKLYLMIPEGRTDGEAKMKLLKWFNGYLYKPVKTDMLRMLLLEQSDRTIDLEVVEESTEGKSGKASLLSAASTRKGNSPPYPAEGARVLVAEDHPVNRKILKSFLEKMGAEVLLAENGREAADIAVSEKNISLIFMDIQMPVMNGLESAQIIRASGYTGIIAACTANTESEDFDQYYQAGMDTILFKPFKRTDIQKIFETYFPPDPVSPPPVQGTHADGAAAENSGKTAVADFSDMMDTLAGDYQLAEQILSQFIQQTDSNLEECSRAAGAGDFEKMVQIAHGIKGSAGSLSARSLSEAAKNLESASKKRDGGQAAAYLKDCAHLFDLFRNEADKWLAGHPCRL